MTNRLAVAAAALLSLPLLAGPIESAPARESDAKRTSKNGSLSGDVDGVKFLVTYGRPSVKGRKVWGDIVKGGETWRVGADEATVFAFDGDVLVEGKKLPAGAYGFFVVPGKDPTKDAWTLVFSKEPKQWGAYKYDEKQDALRVTVTPKAAEMTELLTFEKKDANTVALRWEKLSVPVQIKKASPVK